MHRISSLYRSAHGRYFVGEEQEVHGVDGALLTPVTDAMAREWLEKHGKAALAVSLFKNDCIFLRIEIDSDLLHQIDCAAEDAGLSEQAWVLAAISAALAGRGYAGSAGPGDEQQAPVSVT